MSHQVFTSDAAYLLAMTPEQRQVYERGYRDTELDSTVANDAMIACAVRTQNSLLIERHKLLQLGFRDSHPLCVKIDHAVREWAEIASAQRRVQRQLEQEKETEL